MKTLHQTLDASWRTGLYLMFISVCLLAFSLPAAAKPKIAILATGGTIAGAQGIVVAGVGDGNMTAPALDALAALAKKGMVVVRSSRVGNGIVKRNVEVDDDKLGFVTAQDLNPQKARILLQLALIKTSDPAEIQRMFEEY